MLQRMVTVGGSGDNSVHVQRGKPASNIITCGFQPSKVYLSDPKYNGSNKLIRLYDAAIEENKYLQSFNGSVSWENGATPFVTITSNGYTLGSSLFALLSNDIVVTAVE